MPKSLAKWYFGTFCARCALIDSEKGEYGRDHWDKLHILEEKLGDISHKEFVGIVKMSTFCKPVTRRFKWCKICEALGVPQRGPFE